MEDDGISFNLNWRYIATAVISILAGIGIMFLFIVDNSEELKLLKTYQEAFVLCQGYCQDLNQTGYIRAVDQLHHKCFCYSDLTRCMT